MAATDTKSTKPTPKQTGEEWTPADEADFQYKEAMANSVAYILPQDDIKDYQSIFDELSKHWRVWIPDVKVNLYQSVKAAKFNLSDGALVQGSGQTKSERQRMHPNGGYLIFFKTLEDAKDELSRITTAATKSAAAYKSSIAPIWQFRDTLMIKHIVSQYEVNNVWNRMNSERDLLFYIAIGYNDLSGDKPVNRLKTSCSIIITPDKGVLLTFNHHVVYRGCAVCGGTVPEKASRCPTCQLVHYCSHEHRLVHKVHHDKICRAFSFVR